MLLGVFGMLTTKYITFVGMNLPEIMHPMVYYSVLTWAPVPYMIALSYISAISAKNNSKTEVCRFSVKYVMRRTSLLRIMYHLEVCYVQDLQRN